MFLVAKLSLIGLKKNKLYFSKLVTVWKMNVACTFYILHRAIILIISYESISPFLLADKNPSNEFLAIFVFTSLFKNNKGKVESSSKGFLQLKRQNKIKCVQGMNETNHFIFGLLCCCCCC